MGIANISECFFCTPFCRSRLGRENVATILFAKWQSNFDVNKCKLCKWMCKNHLWPELLEARRRHRHARSFRLPCVVRGGAATWRILSFFRFCFCDRRKLLRWGDVSKVRASEWAFVCLCRVQRMFCVKIYDFIYLFLWKPLYVQRKTCWFACKILNIFIFYLSLRSTKNVDSCGQRKTLICTDSNNIWKCFWSSVYWSGFQKLIHWFEILFDICYLIPPAHHFVFTICHAFFLISLSMLNEKRVDFCAKF